MNMKEQIAKSIAVALKDQLTEKEIQHLFEKPKKSELGDVAFPCFTLVKKCKKSPNSIAEEIKNNLTCEIIKDVQAIGGYVNIFFNQSIVTKQVLTNNIYMEVSRNQKGILSLIFLLLTSRSHFLWGIYVLL